MLHQITAGAQWPVVHQLNLLILGACSLFADEFMLQVLKLTDRPVKQQSTGCCPVNLSNVNDTPDKQNTATTNPNWGSIGEQEG